jgi:hypothetical protein
MLQTPQKRSGERRERSNIITIWYVSVFERILVCDIFLFSSLRREFRFTHKKGKVGVKFFEILSEKVKFETNC